MNYQQTIEPIIKKRLKTSQLLLAISVLIAVFVAYLGMHSGSTYYLWAIYFVVIGALSLPNINRSKKDLLDFKQNMLTQTEGTVLDVFPEKAEDGKWMIFLDVDGQKDIVEFLLPFKPDIEASGRVRVYHTSILRLPVRIEIL